MMQKEGDIHETIKVLVDFAYDKTVERMNAIEDASPNSVYRTIGMTKGDYRSYLLSYMNYY
jgi:hypothetical protein